MTAPLPSHELRVAIEAAKAGAQKALEYYDQGIETTLKADNTVVTKADIASEDAIKTTILASYPNANFLAEESGGSIDKDEFWVIDPIDGTRAFSRGIPLWNVLIALSRNREIVLGLSYYPVLNILTYAEKGRGAFCNNEEIHVSNIDKLNKAFMGTGSPGRFAEKRLLIELYEKVPAVRSLELNYTNINVASGKMDALVDAYGMSWDLAPFKVIIEEAGGKITRLDGSEWRIDDQKGAIVSNGLLHEEVLSITKKYY